MAINPLAQKWIAALLSGKYEQGTKCLHSADNKFCCLGVAAEVVFNAQWSEESNRIPCTAIHAKHVINYKTVGDLLPEELWCQLTEGMVTSVHQINLAVLNDAGWSFERLVKEVILPAFEEPPLSEQVEAAY